MQRTFSFFSIIIYSLYISIGALCFLSCKKIIEVPAPITGLSRPVVFTDDKTAAAAVTGIFQGLMSSSSELSGGNQGISVKLGLTADELTQYFSDPVLSQYYTNSLNKTNAAVLNSWANFYKYIYQCNAAIESLTNSGGVSKKLSAQLKGETYFIRAFLYFYLTNLYGDVPLILSTDYRQNANVSRIPQSKIYDQIVSDLLLAQGLLSDDYLAPNGSVTAERVRPNKFAVYAMLSRVYLFTGSWAKASEAATAVINNSEHFELEADLDNVFLHNSSEAIWQLQPIDNSYNTYDGYTFILTRDFNSRSPVALSNSFLGDFESNDNRVFKWIGEFKGYHFSYKYKVKGGASGVQLSEYLMVLRLAEQYLIRSEAKLELGDVSGATEDLNIIRNRSGLTNYTGLSDEASLHLAIMHERKVELFTEWGHRWLDLKRTKNINKVMEIVTPIKGGAWSSNWQLFPIPQNEIITDPSLTQNQGY